MKIGAYPFRVPELTYLDHAASTPMRPEAVEAMLPYLTEHFGNPSGSHRAARDARKAVDESRELVASLLGVDSSEVVFTGDGTEADNLAVLGVPAARGGVAVCSAVEHHAVLHPVEHLGGRVVAVDSAGAIDLDALAAALDDGVSVVSVMAVNNEVGTIQPIAQVAELVAEKAPAAVLHTDAIQAFAWLDVAEVCAGAHLVSISGHKFGGPKGVGVLAVRKGVELEPLVLGGGQERGRRSGTQNVAGIVAIATAMSLAHDERKAMVDRVGALRDRLVDGLASQIDRPHRDGAARSKGRGQRARPRRRRRVRGVALLARPRGRVRVSGLVVLERCDGSVARAGRNGRVARAGPQRGAALARSRIDVGRCRSRARGHPRRGHEAPQVVPCR